MADSESDRRPVALFDSSYGNFASEAQAAVRAGAFGEDIGQTSWLFADEWRGYLRWLRLTAASELLDVACGGGGPALYAARENGCRVTGIDKHPKGVATATALAAAGQMSERVRFLECDATQPLPFPDRCFDALICIDAVLHLPDRRAVLAEWHRVLRPGGRVVYSDPIVVTGAVSNEEIAIRSSLGFFLFTPLGYNERLLAEAGFALVRCDDATATMAAIAQRWGQARTENRDALLALEGAETYEGQQRFFGVTARVAGEGRLSRFVFHAQVPDSA
jgi:SAM-dependent methyltransferase